MEDKRILLIYYLLKRLFLFWDEWLFYYTLYFLYNKKYNKITLTVLIYGISCIYTSYKNIDLIEKKLFDVDQAVFLTKSFNIDTAKYIYHVIEDFFKQKLLK